jgi:hypothetical protein
VLLDQQVLLDHKVLQEPLQGKVVLVLQANLVMTALLVLLVQDRLVQQVQQVLLALDIQQ